jgi:hypothetical protein
MKPIQPRSGCKWRVDLLGGRWRSIANWHAVSRRHTSPGHTQRSQGQAAAGSTTVCIASAAPQR